MSSGFFTAVDYSVEVVTRQRKSEFYSGVRCLHATFAPMDQKG
jgi:hypothetical protein